MKIECYFSGFREVKDNYAGTESRLDQQDGMPDLLKAVLQANPEVFSGKGKIVQFFILT